MPLIRNCRTARAERTLPRSSRGLNRLCGHLVDDQPDPLSAGALRTIKAHRPAKRDVRRLGE
jgi:hypothetical protein